MAAYIPWFALTCNIVGVGLMLRFGLPNGIPLFGRRHEEDRGDLWGLLGLALFILSIAIRVSTIIFTDS